MHVMEGRLKTSGRSEITATVIHRLGMRKVIPSRYLLTLLSSYALMYGVLVASEMIGVRATFSCKRLNEEHDLHQGTERMDVMGLSRSRGQSPVPCKRPGSRCPLHQHNTSTLPSSFNSELHSTKVSIHSYLYCFRVPPVTPIKSGGITDSNAAHSPPLRSLILALI